jgi:hypothetical protein
MKSATLFLQMVILLVGIGVAALLLWEPHLEGRNAHATVFQIYFNDPFLAYCYAASLSFFAALYQAFRLLGHVRQNQAFSPAGVKAASRAKFCAAALIACVAGGELFILLGHSDDHAGGVFIGALIAFGAAIMAATAATFEGVLRSGLEVHSRTM